MGKGDSRGSSKKAAKKKANKKPQKKATAPKTDAADTEVEVDADDGVFQSLGTNIEYQVDEDNRLILVVDLDQADSQPKPGKKMCQIGNSGGFAKIDAGGEEIRVNLYVGKYPPRG